MSSTHSRVLEIGCGHGFNVSVLSRRKITVGVDVSAENIAIARRRYPHCDFQVMDMSQMEFEDCEFDECYALDVLEHVDDVDAVVSEVHRVLRDGGTFVVNVPAEKSEGWLLRIRPTYFEEIHHVRIFRGDDLPTLVTQYGFRLTKTRQKGFIQHLELYALFRSGKRSSTQVSIGSWRDSWLTRVIHTAVLFTDPIILQTPAVWFPLWAITIPLGQLVDRLGSLFFPKSVYYEFAKIIPPAVG